MNILGTDNQGYYFGYNGDGLPVQSDDTGDWYVAREESQFVAHLETHKTRYEVINGKWVEIDTYNFPTL